MNGSDLQELLKEGDELVSSLECEMQDCLNKLDTLQEEGVKRFVARRQEIVDAIQNFDRKMSIYRSTTLQWGVEEKIVLEQFSNRMGDAFERLLNVEGMLLGLAKNRLLMLNEELTVIARGRRAIHGYGGDGRNAASFLNRSA